MIVHNRDSYNEQEYGGSGLIDTVLGLVNSVIQHKDAISVVKDVINIGKDIKELTKTPTKPPDITKSPTRIEPEAPPPDEVINIIKKIKSLSEGSGFRFV